MQSPAISVVIPVYNGGVKVTECLHRLASQDFDLDFEVILVDDASPDDSVTSMRDTISGLPNKDRFRIIECSENGKAGTARNRGVAEARGEYILFIDQDDYPDISLLRILYSLSEGGSIDCISCGVQDKHSVYLRDDISGSITPAIRSDMSLRHGYVFGNLLKRKMLIDNNIRFPENVFFEDVLYNVSLWGHLSSYRCTDEVLYFREIDEDSQTASMSLAKLKDRISASRWYMDRFQNDDAMKATEDAAKTQALYYMFESPILWMLHEPSLYDENLASQCIELARRINPSWDFVHNNEKRFSSKELKLLQQIYSGQKHLAKIVPKYHLIEKAKQSLSLKPLKAVYKRIRNRGGGSIHG